MLIKSKGFTDKELDRFRALQRTSFDILETMAASLKEGQTEKEVTKSFGTRLPRRWRLFVFPFAGCLVRRAHGLAWQMAGWQVFPKVQIP